MQKLIILQGISGSTRREWAKNMVAFMPHTVVEISTTDLRNSIFAGSYTTSNDEHIRYLRDCMITYFLDNKFDVISSDMGNLEEYNVQHLRDLVKDKAEVEIVSFKNELLGDCIARDKDRPDSVGEEIVKKQYERYIACK